MVAWLIHYFWANTSTRTLPFHSLHLAEPLPLLVSAVLWQEDPAAAGTEANRGHLLATKVYNYTLDFRCLCLNRSEWSSGGLWRSEWRLSPCDGWWHLAASGTQAVKDACITVTNTISLLLIAGLVGLISTLERITLEKVLGEKTKKEVISAALCYLGYLGLYPPFVAEKAAGLWSGSQNHRAAQDNLMNESRAHSAKRDEEIKVMMSTTGRQKKIWHCSVIGWLNKGRSEKLARLPWKMEVMVIFSDVRYPILRFCSTPNFWFQYELTSTNTVIRGLGMNTLWLFYYCSVLLEADELCNNFKSLFTSCCYALMHPKSEDAPLSILVLKTILEISKIKLESYYFMIIIIMIM